MDKTTSNGWTGLGFGGLGDLGESIAMQRHEASVAAKKTSNRTVMVPKVLAQGSTNYNPPGVLPPPVPPPRRVPPPPPLTAPMPVSSRAVTSDELNAALNSLASSFAASKPKAKEKPAASAAQVDETPKSRGRKKGPLSDEEKAKRAATRAKNAKGKGKTKRAKKAPKKEGEAVAKKGKKKKEAEGGETSTKGGKMAKPKKTKSEKIVAHAGSLFGDIAVVSTAALAGARLDDMIDARPFGQDPSTILLAVELGVTIFGVIRRKRRVAHYGALATAGTAAGKLARASKKTPHS